MRLPKWDGHSRPPRYHVIGHRVLGPAVAFAVALWDAARAFERVTVEFGRSYRAIRSYHADRWSPSTGEDR